MPVTSIIRVSTAADGTQGNGGSFSPAFSPDGTKVAFFGYPDNFVSGDTNGQLDSFVKNLSTGEIERVSTDAAGAQANGPSFYPVFSPDGTKVFFEGAASNLVPVADPNNHIYVKTLATGAIERVSSDAMGAPGDGQSFGPVSFSLDGTKVAFSSEASNFVAGDTIPWAEVFVKTLATGAFERASTDAMGVGGNSSSGGPVFSPDGTKVAFTSNASNLVPGDTNGTEDIFVKTLATGAIARVSTDGAGGQGNGGSGGPVFSPDGTKVAFASGASNLVPGDTNGTSEIFVKTLATGAIGRISTDAAGVQGNGGAGGPAFSPDGTKVAFYSEASNLVPGDTNGTGDNFVKTLATGAISIVTIAADSAHPEAFSLPYPFLFSPDWTKVAFESIASDLVPNDTNDGNDIFVATLGAAPPAKIFHDITDNTNRSLFKAAYAGNDSIDGTGGADRIRGWAGRDTILGEGGNDEIRGDGVGLPYDPDLPDTDPARFVDSIRAGAGNDSVWGGGGNDTLLGEDGNDRLYGQGGGDSIDGGRGADEINGAENNDTCRGGADNDWIAGGAGLDSLYGDDGNDKIYAFAPDSEASRWGWIDDGTGDRIEGGNGNDTLIGGKGIDTLTGGAGADVMSGGGGDDIFRYGAASETGNSLTTCDIITDFQQGHDTIDLRDFDASTVLAGKNGFVWRGTGPFTTSGEGELRYQKYDNAGTANDYTVIFGDTDADTASEFQIKLQGLVTLTPEDFKLLLGPIVVTGDAPAYNWYHGCGPTAVGSIVGYWDLKSFPNLFDASGWSAVRETINVQDQISSPAHNAKYDPFPDNPNLPDPPDTSIADFMHTSEGGLGYGWSFLDDADDAVREYASYRGYAFDSWNESLDTYGWYGLKHDIDSGQPPVFLVDTNGDGGTDHFVPVFGYEDRGDDGLWYGHYTCWSEAENLEWHRFQPMGTPWGVGFVTIVHPHDGNGPLAVRPELKFDAGVPSGDGFGNLMLATSAAENDVLLA